ncbi:MAG: DEAD/DEAH box helicase [Deltaproteobacteria bacterium]|nr:DEAD/DEAH box helicase [Deltaproteobacteria bacterium]
MQKPKLVVEKGLSILLLPVSFLLDGDYNEDVEEYEDVEEFIDVDFVDGEVVIHAPCIDVLVDKTLEITWPESASSQGTKAKKKAKPTLVEPEGTTSPTTLQLSDLSAHLTFTGRFVLDIPQCKSQSNVAAVAVNAFATSTGDGMLHLALVHPDTQLSLSLAFFRKLAKNAIAEIAAAQDPLRKNIVALPSPSDDAVKVLLQHIPPIPGAERFNERACNELWLACAQAFVDQASSHSNGVDGVLDDAHAKVHSKGRVCLHIAHHQHLKDAPFAFVATYVRQGRSGDVHVPLRAALEEFSNEDAGPEGKERLLDLLKPLSRAAESSARLRALVDEGDIYHPLAFTEEEAYTFLLEAEHFEEAGLSLRLPDFWKTRTRPKVSIDVGESPPSTLGLSAMVDFNVHISLGGERLSNDEIQTILGSTSGLALIRGQWVEVDANKLKSALSLWESAAATAKENGVSFVEAMRMMAGVDRLSASIDDGLATWADVHAGSWLKEQLQTLRSPGTKARLDDDPNLNATLRPYQKIGVHWLWKLQQLEIGGCLADDMGLGKTLQVIALLSQLKNTKGADEKKHSLSTSLPSLLVLPATLVENWRLELKRFAPHLVVKVLHSSSMPAKELKEMSGKDIADVDVALTTYGTATRTEWFAQTQWDCLVLDEAQAIKNPSTKQTRAVKRVPARWRLALTGTPVENKLGDLWSIFDFINKGLLGGAKSFGKQVSDMSKSELGYTPLRKLIQPYLLRRLKTDKRVIADLPDKSEVSVRCLLSKKQAALYKQAVKELERTLSSVEGLQRRGLVLSSLMRFKQICNHPSQWLNDGDFAAKDSGKMQRLEAICETIAANQEKVLVFTQFRSMCDPLQEHLSRCFGKNGLVLHGGTPVKKRQELVQQFQNDEEVPFMVLSLKAGGTGLNLTAASHVVHFDRWYNPATENQATDRAYRIGQKRNVLVHKFVTRGTLEERIDKLIACKQALTDEVLDQSGEVKLTEMSDDELLKMVALDFDAAVSA